MERVGNLPRLVASLLLALVIFVGRLAMVLLAIVPTSLGRVIDRLRAAPPAPPPLAGRRPRILFVGGTLNHTTQVQQIAAALPECESAFTWYTVTERSSSCGASARWNRPHSATSCAPAASAT